MPLIECPDCLNRISEAATACPHCGHPFEPVPQTVYVKDTILTRNRGCGDLALIILAVFAAVIVGGCALLSGLSR